MTNKSEDFLVEVFCEELPPKILLKLANAFATSVEVSLRKINLGFTAINYFVTPRRLALIVKQLAENEADQIIERKGPALNVAYDKNGELTPAALGFLKSAGVDKDAIITIKQDQNAWIGFRKEAKGLSVYELMPKIISEAIAALPIPKRMTWGDSNIQFSRPVHSVMMLYGAKIISAEILGCKASNQTRGHRFHAPEIFTVPHANQYVSLLKDKYVIVDFAERRNIIKTAIDKIITNKTLHAHVTDALLDEVTGLVEWPVALLGNFEVEFLDVPKEALMSAMQDHQRYFPVLAANDQLANHFITISNIQSLDQNQVIAGNERVLRARLSDAAFFYETDKEISLFDRVPRLKNMVFQAKLGSIYEKVKRVSDLATWISALLNEDEAQAERAALLAKTDLTTRMVGEFPELQGIMGYYYALHDNESDSVAIAIKEHYLPRFAGDVLPETSLGKIVALADRLDTLVGTFGINLAPTGDKDPYALRRAALGVIRILIEGALSFDLKMLLEQVAKGYAQILENRDVIAQTLHFMMERMRAYYAEQKVPTDVFNAVLATDVKNPLDFDYRIQAVMAFKTLKEAETLAAANKRVSNILAKYTDDIALTNISAEHFEHDAEQQLVDQLAAKYESVATLASQSAYKDILFQLAELSDAINIFFDKVMVMADDKAKRENRILILRNIRHLFLQVADIALLQ